MGFIKRDLKKFVTISAEGELRIPSDEKNPLALKREYELKDGSGGKGVKYETIQHAYFGLIKKISFNDNGFGLMLNVAFEKEGDEDEVIISMSTESSFGIDLMRKLPNIDYKKEIEFAPYSFCDDKLKDRRGVTIRQLGAPDNKVQDYFFDKTTEQRINGMLSPEGDVDSYDKDDWKMYFMRVRKFLVRFTEQNIIPLVDNIAAGRVVATPEIQPVFTPAQPVSQISLAPEQPEGVIQPQEEPSMLEKVMTTFPNSKVIDAPAEPSQENGFGIKNIPF